MNYTDEDDEEEEEESDIVYDDDEDEFGLPSIASMRRRPKKSADTFQSKTVDPGGGAKHRGNNGTLEAGGNAASIGHGLVTGRYRANSSDIAEERGTLMYPSTRKGEGKILRPQYKEILRGKSDAFYHSPDVLLIWLLQILPMP